MSGVREGRYSDSGKNGGRYHDSYVSSQTTSNGRYSDEPTAPTSAPAASAKTKRFDFKINQSGSKAMQDPQNPSSSIPGLVSVTAASKSDLLDSPKEAEDGNSNSGDFFSVGSEQWQAPDPVGNAMSDFDSFRSTPVGAQHPSSETPLASSAAFDTQEEFASFQSSSASPQQQPLSNMMRRPVAQQYPIMMQQPGSTVPQPMMQYPEPTNKQQPGMSTHQMVLQVPHAASQQHLQPELASASLPLNSQVYRESTVVIE